MQIIVEAQGEDLSIETWVRSRAKMNRKVYYVRGISFHFVRRAKPEFFALSSFLSTCKVIEELVRAVEGLSQKQRGIA